MKNSRIFAVLSALSLAFAGGVMPGTAASAVQTEEVKTGRCGANLTWSLDTDTGVLKLEGSGAMYGWGLDGIPWLMDTPKIKTIVLPEALTLIGENGFYGCPNLETINIPDSVTFIGMQAFAQDKNLKEIHIPAGITDILDYTFYICSSLTEVQLPESVQHIGNHAFTLSGITEMTLPASVERIDQMAFYRCEQLTDITILNPACEIGKNAITDTGFDFTGTIHGYADSTAQAYAEENGIRFAEIPPLARGDVDGDGRVTAADSQLTLVSYLEEMVGNGSTLDAVQAIAADVDFDGAVTAADAQYTLLYYLESMMSLSTVPVMWEDIIGSE